MTTRQDATNRALRTFLQGLGFSLAAALVIALLGAIGAATSWQDFWLLIIGWSFFQSVATAVLSWVMRAWLDNRVPTPLPPATGPVIPGTTLPEDTIDHGVPRD